jgi:hypothetical protein
VDTCDDSPTVAQKFSASMYFVVVAAVIVAISCLLFCGGKGFNEVEKLRRRCCRPQRRPTMFFCGICCLHAPSTMSFVFPPVVLLLLLLILVGCRFLERIRFH